MADPDISDHECDADGLLLMPIIITQFVLQAEFPDLDSEDSEGEETGEDIYWIAKSGSRSGSRRRPSCSDWT